MSENTFFGLSAAAYSGVRVCVCVVADVSLSIDKHTHILKSTPVVFSQRWELLLQMLKMLTLHIYIKIKS